MEKKATPVHRSFGAVRLYWNDILALVEIMREASDKVTLETDRHKTEDPHELQSLDSNVIYDLELKTTEPYVSVHFSPSSVFLFISDDTLVQRGVYEKLGTYIRSRQRRLRLFTHTSFPSSVVIGYSLASVFGAASSRDASRLAFPLALLLAGIAWATLATLNDRKRSSIIVLGERANYPGFWARNQDRIVVAFIAAVLGSLGTWVVMNLVN